MHRFFVSGSLAAEVKINSEDIKHIKNVLRMKVGDKLICIDAAGTSGLCEIISLTDGVIVALRELLEENSEPPLRVILGQGLGKGEKMDFVVQKAVELGVSEVVPLALERCVASYDKEKALSKVQRWQKIAVEAAKQSRRHAIPKVHEVMDLPGALKNFAADARLVFYEAENTNSLRALLQVYKQARSVFLLVGPEGGLSDQEIELCRRSGFSTTSLGKRILRTETAAVAGLAVVMYELGDFGDA